MLPLLSQPEQDTPSLNQQSKMCVTAFISSMIGASMGAIITAYILSIR
jgi:hypothetical protein